MNIVAKTPLAPILALVAPALVSAQSPPGAYARRAPEVVASRAIADTVDRAAAANLMIRHDTTATCNSGAVQFKIIVLRDSANLVRKIHLEGGTDDSAHDISYYYDSGGHLRYVFALRGAVNGTRQTEMAYYSAAGVLLRRDVHRIHGPGYPWPPPDAITNVDQWLANPCQ